MFRTLAATSVRFEVLAQLDLPVITSTVTIVTGTASLANFPSVTPKMIRSCRPI
jgi:hypothetical protein